MALMILFITIVLYFDNKSFEVHMEHERGLVFRGNEKDSDFIKRLTGWKNERYVADVQSAQPFVGTVNNATLFEISPSEVEWLIERFSLEYEGEIDLSSFIPVYVSEEKLESCKHGKRYVEEMWKQYQNRFSRDDMEKILGPISIGREKKTSKYDHLENGYLLDLFYCEKLSAAIVCIAATHFSQMESGS